MHGMAGEILFFSAPTAQSESYPQRRVFNSYQASNRVFCHTKTRDFEYYSSTPTGIINSGGFLSRV
jgi:hypothetical protein